MLLSFLKKVLVADADLVMNCNKLEKKGIKTVLITDEYAGQDGASQS